MSSPAGASSGKEAPSLPTPWGPPDTAQRSPGSLCLLGEVFATHVSLPSPQPYPRKPKPRCPSSASPAAFPALCPRYVPCSPGDALGQRGIPRARLWDRGFNSKHTGAVSKSCFFCTFTIIRDFARGPCCEAEAGCDPKPGGSAPALVRVGAFWQHPDGPAPRRGGCVSGGVMSAPAPNIQGKLGQLQPPGAGEGKTTLCSGSRGLSGMPFSSSL